MLEDQKKCLSGSINEHDKPCSHAHSEDVAMSYLPVGSHAGHVTLAHGVLHARHVLLDSCVGALVGPGCHGAASQRTQEVQKYCGVIDSCVAVS